jgi:hypothetical protein
MILRVVPGACLITLDHRKNLKFPVTFTEPSSSAEVIGENIQPETSDFVCSARGAVVCESACEYMPRRPEESVLYGVVAGPGASTPKYLVILNLGGGTSAASRSINSIGS